MILFLDYAAYFYVAIFYIGLTLLSIVSFGLDSKAVRVVQSLLFRRSANRIGLRLTEQLKSALGKGRSSEVPDPAIAVLPSILRTHYERFLIFALAFVATVAGPYLFIGTVAALAISHGEDARQTWTWTIIFGNWSGLRLPGR